MSPVWLLGWATMQPGFGKRKKGSPWRLLSVLTGKTLMQVLKSGKGRDR